MSLMHVAVRHAGASVLAGLWMTLGAQTPLDSESVRGWAKEYLAKQRLWSNQSQGRAPQSTQDYLTLLQQHDRTSRRAALIALGQRPVQEWAEAALKNAEPDVVWYLFQKGYKQPGNDPFRYLVTYTQLQRPWTQGLGLHLGAEDSWQIQWIPSPMLASQMALDASVPPALRAAPIPSVLMHLQSLKPGLTRLKQLSGGEDGLNKALLASSRAGFLLRHVDQWMQQGPSVVQGLATREAWILHYGRSRRGEAPTGTLIFLPGGLPTGSKLALEWLKLLPGTTGVRARNQQWTIAGKHHGLTQVRGSGGVLHLLNTADGTYLADREAPLRALLSGEFPTLGERPDWCKVAMAGAKPETQVSLWVLPTTAVGASFEVEAMMRRKQRADQPWWPNPFVAKAAPRTGALALSLGAGPTEHLLNALWRVDDPFTLQDPEPPAFTEGGSRLSPEQQKAFEQERHEVRLRRERKGALRTGVEQMTRMLDLRGAALYMDGFVQPPSLTPAQTQAIKNYQEWRYRQRERAEKLLASGKLRYGAYNEPGLAPALALALPIKEGQETAVSTLMGRLWPTLFKGSQQKKKVGDIELKRVQTVQALWPTYAITKGYLVLGTDEAPVTAVLSGLQGQAPTLADWESKSFGRAEVDGTRLAQQLEFLLVEYLGQQENYESARAEVAGTFGAFFGTLRGLGKRSLELDWTPAGVMIRPR